MNTIYFGQITKAEISKKHFPGGHQPPIPYDPALHKFPANEILLDFEPIPAVNADGCNWQIKSDCFTFFSGWKEITGKSLVDCGALTKLNKESEIIDLKDKYFSAEIVPIMQKNGQLAKTVDIKFRHAYASMDECERAYNSYKAKGGSTTEYHNQQTSDFSKHDQMVTGEALQSGRAAAEKYFGPETDMELQTAIENNADHASATTALKTAIDAMTADPTKTAADMCRAAYRFVSDPERKASTVYAVSDAEIAKILIGAMVERGARG